MNPRAITGFGVASSLGIGRQAFLEAYEQGASGRRRDGKLESFDAAPYAHAGREGLPVAEVPDFDATRYLGDKGLRPLDRLTKLLVVAARLALHDAGLKRDGAWLEPVAGAASWAERAGLVVSNAYGSLEAITELDRVAVLEDARYINPSRFPLTVSNSAAGYVSIWEDMRAVNVSVSDGNCGALDAVACADVLLDQNRADALLVGGGEAMSEALFLAFRRLGTSKAPDDGPCIGEGAALLLLESAEAAAARSATPLAEVIGYGTCFDPPEREGALVHAAPGALEHAMGAALADAGVRPEEVDLVVCGVSGLRVFDEAELLAVQRVVPDAPVVAPKLALGETLGAGGAMAMLAAVASLQGRASPSHVVRGALRTTPRVALVTSLGYYGNASALVMRQASR